MLGRMGLFWQPALVRDFITDTIVMFIWANKDACLLANQSGLNNPLKFRGNYSATSNNMKLAHWPLMGGLLHLVSE